ncbi:hypothetical protein F66182_2425 [Fusarium sp. NRRL 66182]|nr:hypothetical protein F66182_2425 [Fusarium sp. NRRL 66182]
MVEFMSNQDSHELITNETQLDPVSESAFIPVEPVEEYAPYYPALSKTSKKKRKKKSKEMEKVEIEIGAPAIESSTEPHPQEESPVQVDQIPQPSVSTEVGVFEENPAAGEEPYDESAQEIVFNHGVELLPDEVEGSTTLLYLPYGAQHRLVVYLQQHLEHICFAFGQRHMAEVLLDRGWDCPEAVELHIWMQEFRSQEHARDGVPSIKQHRRLLDSIIKIRNYAVDRTRIDCAEVERLLSYALTLTKIMGEGKSVEVTEKLREDIIGANQWLGEETEQLNKRFDSKLNEIKSARVKLDELEEATNAAFRRGVLQRQERVSSKVILSIQKAEASGQKTDPQGQPVTMTGLDWVNDLENSLVFEEDD